MPKAAPDYQDADLLLRVYELRREPVMRESRTAINSKFWPKTYDELLAVTRPDHPLNAAYRQTGTYWEMVYGIARHGIVNPDFWIESNGEGLLLFARVSPYLDRIRADFSPTSFQNAEWMSTSCESARRVYRFMGERVKKVLAGT
jgi:hypothetical protein